MTDDRFQEGSLLKKKKKNLNKFIHPEYFKPTRLIKEEEEEEP